MTINIQPLSAAKIDELLTNSFHNLASDAIIIVDLEGKVLDVNKKFEKMHGWKREEAIGLVLPMLPEECRPEALQVYRRILQGEEFVCQERLIMRKDSTCFYANVTISPLKDERGEVIAFVDVERDATEKKRMESELAEREKEFRHVLKLSPIPIVLHREGQIKFVNNMGIKLFGGKCMEEIIGRSVLDFFDPSFHPVILERMEKVTQTDDYMEYLEMKLVRLDGEVLDVEVSSIYVHKYVGEPLVQIVIRDLTERKKTEEMIRRSEKLSLLGQLAAGIAHEIRNPLTAIKGFVQLLKARNTPYTEIILSEIERINTIVSDFMTVAKPHSLHFADSELRPIVEHVAFFMQPQAHLFNVQIQIVNDFGSCLVHCDPDQIEQVFINILKNAIESMPQGGEIELSVCAKGSDHVLIRITDQGMGIPEDQLDKLGEPFFSMKESGTGLGLAVCHRIIEAHHGKISFQSKINQGTTVEIELPMLKAEMLPSKI